MPVENQNTEFITCYKCRDGLPISNRFPYENNYGTPGVCPKGWTSFSDPCNQPPESGMLKAEFKKKVYGKRSAKEKLDEEFTEFRIEERTAEDFFELYNEFFHQIPRKDIMDSGDINNHLHLVNESKDYIGDYINPLAALLATLEQQKEDIQNEIDNIERFHPYLNNNSIVMDEYFEGNESEGTKFLIQSGKKRTIKGEGENLYINIKNQLGFTNRPENEFIFYFSSPGLSLIPTGPDINDPTDIFEENKVINTYNPGQTQRRAPRYQNVKATNLRQNIAL